MMSDPEIPSSSSLNCFDYKPDPLAWSFVRQTLLSVFNINDFAKEAQKSNISDLESILKDVKLLTTFQKGESTNGNSEHSNEGRSNNIKLSNDYAEDEIELLKFVSTCLVPESNNYKMEISLQEDPSFTEKDDGVSENGNTIVQYAPSCTVMRHNILYEGPLVSKDDNSVVQDVPLVPANSNDILQKDPAVTENVDEITHDGDNSNTNMTKELHVMEKADQIMPNGCPINENGNASMSTVLPVMEDGDQIMLNGCPIDENCNKSIPKDLPFMGNDDQIMPKRQKINQFCKAFMPKVHPATENSDRNIPEQHLITENSSENMHGPSGNANINSQAPPAENANNGMLPKKFCLKCHRGGSLIMCEVENCFTSFHERCVVYRERSELGTFKCPLCFYKHTAMAYQIAKKRYSQAKKSLAWFLVTDKVDNRIDKRKSAKVNGDMNVPINSRKRRNKTDIQVKVEAVETEVYQNGSQANSVQAQLTKDNTVSLDAGKTKADLNAVSSINGMQEEGEATTVKLKDTSQEVLNMPVHKARAETIPSSGGSNPSFTRSENQHTLMNSKSRNREKSSYNDKGEKRPNSDDDEKEDGQIAQKPCEDNGNVFSENDTILEDSDTKGGKNEKRGTISTEEDGELEPKDESNDEKARKKTILKNKKGVNEVEEELSGKRSPKSPRDCNRGNKKNVVVIDEEEEDEEEEEEEEEEEDKLKLIEEEEALARPIGDPITVSGKGKKKKNYYLSFKYESTTYDLEDPVLLTPTSELEKPYVAIIKDISESGNGLMVTGQWFYRPEEAGKKGGGTWQSNDTRELFYSFHLDDVPAESVMHKCVVHFVPLNKKIPLRSENPGFIVQKVYDTIEKRLWKLMDKDYENCKQEEINRLVQKTIDRIGELPDVEKENVGPIDSNDPLGKWSLRRKNVSSIDTRRVNGFCMNSKKAIKPASVTPKPMPVTPASCPSNASEHYRILAKFKALTGDLIRDKWSERILQGIQPVCVSNENSLEEIGADDGGNFVWPDSAVEATTALEKAAHKTCSEFQKYDQKLRQLVYNLKNNALLARRLLNKELDPAVILYMSPNELKAGQTADERTNKKPEESVQMQMIDVQCPRCTEKKVGIKDVITSGHGSRCQLECQACGNSWYATGDAIASS